MDKEKALEIIKSQLPEKRYIHTLGVVETAVKLANKYGANPKKAELAAIFHDYAKYRPVSEMRSIVIEHKMDPNILKYGRELLHAPVGAFLVKKEVGIEDEETLNGIRYHTTGRPYMSLLEKIIYIADYIEPNRTFKGVEEVRVLAEEDLDLALVTSIANTVHFLLKKQQPVFPDTLATYNHLILKEEF
ncbi:HD domain-containing protein [Anaerobacillus alkaliphilus]|uniref:bis(5'-nucleosyl)-tetraphosphatase (symmetrical) n=1 Tax=Anaerobacillus alkaliphilus TaxID=1548597 RepID=A0A4V1LGB6_9BACI|nr:bis(5'-nucleosyl)-tetraphosphatase (symmetrical) YqeK [Anaerobacillus alkaliphilus]RXJ00002.1 HD domain-containing protein [Anaerobacillus alkaliphilus]